jgi:hypothetical protein
MVCPPAVHLNPAKYEDPLTFNPWRWEVGHQFFENIQLLQLDMLDHQLSQKLKLIRNYGK